MCTNQESSLNFAGAIVSGSFLSSVSENIADKHPAKIPTPPNKIAVVYLPNASFMKVLTRQHTILLHSIYQNASCTLLEFTFI